MSEQEECNFPVRAFLSNTNAPHATARTPGSRHDYSIAAGRTEPLVDVPSQRAHDVLHDLLHQGRSLLPARRRTTERPLSSLECAFALLLVRRDRFPVVGGRLNDRHQGGRGLQARTKIGTH